MESVDYSDEKVLGSKRNIHNASAILKHKDSLKGDRSLTSISGEIFTD